MPCREVTGTRHGPSIRDICPMPPVHGQDFLLRESCAALIATSKFASCRGTEQPATLEALSHKLITKARLNFMPA